MWGLAQPSAPGKNVGLYIDIVGVTGSIPVAPTIFALQKSKAYFPSSRIKKPSQTQLPHVRHNAARNLLWHQSESAEINGKLRYVVNCFSSPNTVLRFIPESGYEKLTGMSEKAIAHWDVDLQHRHLVVQEAAGLQGEWQRPNQVSTQRREVALRRYDHRPTRWILYHGAWETRTYRISHDDDPQCALLRRRNSNAFHHAR